MWSLSVQQKKSGQKNLLLLQQNVLPVNAGTVVVEATRRLVAVEVTPVAEAVA